MCSLVRLFRVRALSRALSRLGLGLWLGLG